MKVTEEWLEGYNKRRKLMPVPVTPAAAAAVAVHTPKHSKYRNQVTYVDGKRFPSVLEADRYCELCLLVIAGVVDYFHRQVAIELTGGVRYVCDFQVFWSSGIVDYEDTKGILTQACKNKLKQVAALYPKLRMKILRRGDVKRFTHTAPAVQL